MDFQRDQFFQNRLPFLISVAIHGSVILGGLMGIAYARKYWCPPEEMMAGSGVISVDLQSTAGKGGGATDLECLRDVGAFPLVTLNCAGPCVLQPSPDFTPRAPMVDTSGVARFQVEGVAVEMPELEGLVNGRPACLTPGIASCVGLGPWAWQRVVFVADASGSMLEQLDVVRREICNGIDALKPVQAFNVIFARNGQVTCLAGESQRGAPRVKQGARDFVEHMPAGGSSEPLPAFRAAFANSPAIVYFLTDGGFPDREKVLAEVGRLNSAGKVKLHVLMVSGGDASNQAFLRQLASANGGVFKVIGR